ncbi:hypothetical protein MD484_g245, partial [Candolleomyces efflorescens]
MSSGLPKAVLYYHPKSIWSSVARLAVEEKGYAADEIDFKIVDINKGENYDPTFLRLNPKATVPTLVVPLSNTLSEDVDSRYKALTDSTTIVEFLDKSRSSLSRTHTTSTAPAPALTPATIAATSIAKTIVYDIIHSDEASPGKLKFYNARDEAGLKKLRQVVLPALQGRADALRKHIADGESGVAQVSEKTKQFWASKLAWIEPLAKVIEAGDRPTESLSETEKEERAAFFKVAKQTWETDLPNVLGKLTKEMVGPFALGDQLSVADMHLIAWVTRLVTLAGGSGDDEGKTVIVKIEEYVGGEHVSRKKLGKLGTFWDGIKGVRSWQKIYGEGVF